MKIVVIVALVVFNVVLVLAVVVKLLRRWGESTLRQMRDRTALRGEDSLRGDGFANFRGILSDGVPLRGNAAVLLTTRALYVVKLWPHREFAVPLERMTRVELSRSFMGGVRSAGFLIVHFRGDAGEDAISLSLRRMPEWVAELVKAARPYVRSVQGQTLGKGPQEGGADARGPETGTAPPGSTDPSSGSV